LTVGALREAARAALDPALWTCLEAGDQGEGAWDAIALRPHILRGVTDPSIETTVLGQPIAMPILLAPTGRATRFHPGGELAVLSAAAAVGSIALLPSSVAAGAGALLRHGPVGANAWQQLYFLSDRGAMRAQLEASREAGCRAIVVTADLLPGGGPVLPSPPCAIWESAESSRPAAAFTGATFDDLTWLCAEAGLPVR
jgi:isopentenyl diphosphate isomerase/L-lactate dehydrogenase-like FMN-dependent dehydrogenase